VSEATVAVNDGRATRKIPRVRQGETTRFIVDGQKGHLTAAAAAGGALGEITIRTAKQGSTLAGMMDALGSVVSLGLQAGAPLEDYVSEFANMRFAPAGRTDDPELPQATSIMDYVARRLAVDFLPPQQRMEMGILTATERAELVDAEVRLG
jgi:ribonucleoside-diphosphate reductase alpha chain